MSANTTNSLPEIWGLQLLSRYTQPGQIRGGSIAIQRRLKNDSATFVAAIQQRWGQSNYAVGEELLPIVSGRSIVPETTEFSESPVNPQLIVQSTTDATLVQRKSLGAIVPPPIIQTPTSTPQKNC